MGSMLSTLVDKRTPRLKVNRRDFLKYTSALAAASRVGGLFTPRKASAVTTGANPPDPVETEPGVQIKYSVCLMCHSVCGIRAKVKDGVLLKIDGNPYHPNSLEPEVRLPFNTPVEESYKVLGRVCVKSQAYPETVYSPYRLRGPLKRAGKRGEGKWIAISWDQALDEIAAKLKQYRSFEPIDPNFPELGPKVNQVVFMPGRYEHGQKEFGDRFWGKCYGTINYRIDHTSICEESHHIAGYLMTEWRKNHFKPDINNCEFIIWFGTSPLEANFPMQSLSEKLMKFKARGGKMAVVDPRFSNTAAHADYWIPAKPGTDAAVAMAIGRWIVDSEKYDVNFLSAPNKQAAEKINETCWTDSTYLVDTRTGKFLRPPDIGLAGSENDYVVMANGTPHVHTEVDRADLFVNTEINGIPVKSVFQLVVERYREKTIEEYAEIAGVDPALLVRVAQEFVSHGKKAVADHYRGTCQHTNGTYASLAVLGLNLLIGNFDWQGGYAAGGGATGAKYTGSGKPGQVNVKNVPGGINPTGIRLDRIDKVYDRDAPNLFKRDGFPAKRPWFPFAHAGVYHEVFPSIKDQYPYPVKALIAYWANNPYSCPAQKKVFEETVKDESKLPLFVVFDIEMGELASYADYVLPDTSTLERWTMPHVSPAILTKTDGLRQPVVGSFDDRPPDAPFDPDAPNNYHPAIPGTRLIEDILIDLGKRMGLPGVGENAFEDGSPLNNAWDWFKKLLNNLAIERGTTIKDIVDRGGWFEEPGKEYDGNGKLNHKYANILHFYIEELATTKDSMTGKTFDPLFKYEPIKDFLDNPIDDSEYPFYVVTYKPVFHAQARTICNPSLVRLMPTNWVEMNREDGERLGLKTGDRVRIISPTGEISENAVVKLTDEVRPGVIAYAHSYGHWQMGSKPFFINNRLTKFDPTRGAGIQLNPIMRLDPVLNDVSLTDKIGGSASFFDTRVRIEKLD